MVRRMVWTSLACALPASYTAGQEMRVPPRPDLSQALAYALQHSPALAIARLTADSAHGEQRIARALPNPTLSTIPGNPFQYSLSENLDVGPQRFYRTRAAGQGVAASQYDVQDARRQVVFAVRQAYFDLLLAESLRTVAAQQRDDFRQLLNVDSIRYAEGDLAQKDVSTTEVQWAHAEATLARAEAGARAARMSLQVTMGVDQPDTSFRVAGELAFKPIALRLDSLQSEAQQHRPDALAARERLDQSRSLKSLSAANLFPTPGVAAVYQPHTPDGSPPFSSGKNYAVGVSFTLPLLDWFGGERERAQAGVDAAVTTRRRIAAQIASDVTVASDNFRAAKALAERYASGLLDRARASLEMQRYAYDHGNASLLDLLTAINAFGDTQSDYYAALHDYWVSAYAVQQAVGGTEELP